MTETVIINALRTPIGKANGMLKSMTLEKMASQVLNALIINHQLDKSAVDDVVLGNVVGPGGNIARLSLLTAGFPFHVPGVTVDRQCGSGLEAITYAMRMIQSNAGHVYLAGGVESVSQAPWKMKRPASAHQIEPPSFYVRAPFSPKDIGDPEMGEAAETVAQNYDISREDQDHFAVMSHRKAIESQASDRFAKEIVPIESDSIQFSKDEGPRSGALERLFKRLSPRFTNGNTEGTVTAGNSCPMNDGAAALLLMSKEEATKRGLNPIGIIVDAVTVGVDPNEPGIGPVPAVSKLLERNGLQQDDIDLMELNEAFASQVLASLKLLNFPTWKVNVSGGAIALGHPYGASGAIIMTRLIHELVRTNKHLGIATMGIGGGMGSAVLIKRV